MKYRFVRYRFVRHWFRFLSRPWINTDILVNILSPRRLEDVFKKSWRHLARRLQDVFKTFSRRIFKTSWRLLGRRKIVTPKTCWRRLEDQQMFAGLVQFNKREKYPWKSVPLQACNFTEATLLQGCFSRFLNCTNCIKLRKGSHIIKIQLFFESKYFMWALGWMN